MQDQILACIQQPSQLEALYRSDKAAFTKSFDQVFPQIETHPIAQVWQARLHYEQLNVSGASSAEWLVILFASLLAGLISKFPEIFHINHEFFFTRNWGFVVFPILTAYFLWKQRASWAKVGGVAFAFLIALVFINKLPDTPVRDTTVLACLHLPLFLWGVLGFAFVGTGYRQLQSRLAFLRYTSELFLITPIILIMGGFLTVITIGLFKLIGIDIASFYFEYVVMFGVSAAPIVGTHIMRANSNLVSKVLPVIAKVFSPLVLLTLVVYLMAMPFSTNSLYQDRQVLFVFNVLLIAVMALILFSIVGTLSQQKSRLEIGTLLFLALTTIVVNGVALSAILSRLSEGFTPNRLAVLGGNVLILINLILVTHRLFLVLNKDGDIDAVETNIATFLPVYMVWIVLVLFVFPVVFGFR